MLHILPSDQMKIVSIKAGAGDPGVECLPLPKSNGRDAMKFMVVWRGRPGLYKTAVQQFLKTGGKAPKGLKTVGRWHVPGSLLGWHLLEGDDLTSLAEHVAEWGDVLEIDVHPVIEDAAAAEAASRVFGK
jgi:hypothetical protein